MDRSPSLTLSLHIMRQMNTAIVHVATRDDHRTWLELFLARQKEHSSMLRHRSPMRTVLPTTQAAAPTTVGSGSAILYAEARDAVVGAARHLHDRTTSTTTPANGMRPLRNEWRCAKQAIETNTPLLHR